jgi:polyisoprenoid-binding protein YceI
MADIRQDQYQAMTGAAGTQQVPRPGRYEIDTSRSAVTFRTRHLFGLAPVRGRFAIRAGTIEIAEPLAGSSVHVQIDPASCRTGNGQRDANVRSERLLGADRYSLITFRSQEVDGLSVPGTLIVRNASLPVTLLIEDIAMTPGSFEARASARVDRTEFGVTGYRGLAGRYLDMTVEVRCRLS